MSVLFHECSVLIFISMFLFPEGQTGEACECSKKQYVFVNRGASDKKVLLLFLVSFNLLNVTFFFFFKQNTRDHAQRRLRSSFSFFKTPVRKKATSTTRSRLIQTGNSLNRLGGAGNKHRC